MQSNRSVYCTDFSLCGRRAVRAEVAWSPSRWRDWARSSKMGTSLPCSSSQSTHFASQQPARLWRLKRADGWRRPAGMLPAPEHHWAVRCSSISSNQPKPHQRALGLCMAFAAGDVGFASRQGQHPSTDWVRCHCGCLSNRQRLPHRVVGGGSSYPLMQARCVRCAAGGGSGKSSSNGSGTNGSNPSSSPGQRQGPGGEQQQQQSQQGPSRKDRLRSLMQNLTMAGIYSPAMLLQPNNGSSPQQAAPVQAQVQGGGAAVTQQPPRRKLTASEALEWGSDWTEDWDPEEDLDEQARARLADEAEAELRARRTNSRTIRDKWITPLLDFPAVTGAVDPDQERTEDNLQGEALVNKDESQTAIRYVAQLVAIPLLTGFILSRALADPVLNYTLENNSEAFAMTDRQKIEGAERVHIEEARLRFDFAIGKIPPLSEEQILEHLREFAEEVQEEERQHNEQNLITVVSDTISSIVFFGIISQASRGRQSLFNTLSRLFDGLSDIAKAVMIILIADTLLGYHSEEGWTGLIELIVGHYGFEAEEEGLVIFVGVVPVVIDVFFKYWIFIGLNRISPGAVVTLKQIDTH